VDNPRTVEELEKENTVLRNALADVLLPLYVICRAPCRNGFSSVAISGAEEALRHVRQALGMNENITSDSGSGTDGL